MAGMKTTSVNQSLTQEDKPVLDAVRERLSNEEERNRSGRPSGRAPSSKRNDDEKELEEVLAKIDAWKKQKIPFPRVSNEQWAQDVAYNDTLRNEKELKKRGGLSKDPSIRVRQCPICFTIFRHLGKLDRHLKSHTPDTHVRCGLCNKGLKYKYNLIPHMKICQKTRKDNETALLHKYYPEFMKELERAATDLSHPMPRPPSPFEMDKYGFITGIDERLEIDLYELIPNYNQNVLDLKIEAEEVGEEYGEEEEDVKAISAIQNLSIN